MGAAVDDHILTYGIVVAYHHMTLFTGEVEILGKGGNDGSLEHLVAAAHTGTVEDAHEGIDDAVVANLYIVFDIDEGIYAAVVAYLGFGRHVCLGTYYTCHISWNLD